jgi:hypothetical protein
MKRATYDRKAFCSEQQLQKPVCWRDELKGLQGQLGSTKVRLPAQQYRLKLQPLYVGGATMHFSGETIIVSDYGAYFTLVNSEESGAAYLNGFLNARTISTAVSAHASRLSLGASHAAATAYIPAFEEDLQARSGASSSDSTSH